MRLLLTVIAVAFLVAAAIVSASDALAYGESFSCSFGKRGACLGYGDTVCSSSGKCVSDDAVCFDSYTCGWGGVRMQVQIR